MMPTMRKPRTVIIPRTRANAVYTKPNLLRWSARVLPLFLLPPVLTLNPATALPGAAAPRDRQAEKPYALIYGTVWGPDDRPLYGVRVEIRRTDKKKHWELYSDHNGEFALRVPPGPSDYVVTADLKGFKYLGDRKLRLDQGVKVHIDNDEREDIGLHLKIGTE